MAPCNAADGPLQCLVVEPDSFGRRFGVCSWRGSCYRHQHCPDDELCSGTGRCVPPVIYFINDVNKPVSMSLYADNTCSSDTWGVSHYQTVPSFARDHGLWSRHEICQVSSWAIFDKVFSHPAMLACA